MYTFLLVWGLFAINKEDLGLVVRAQTDFDRVEMATEPRVQDLLACVQSQAAILPLTAETALVQYRKGYCLLIGATVSGSAVEYADAASSFRKALELLQPPLPSGLKVLSAIAQLRSGADVNAKKLLTEAVAEQQCAATLMSAASCQKLLDTASLWLDKQADSPSVRWSAARKTDDVTALQRLLAGWPMGRFDPDVDQPRRLHEIGEAQLRRKDYTGAIATFNLSLKARPDNAAALYLRGQAHAWLGKEDAALADFQLASRTAFAGAAAAQAHLYRGIWLFHRKDYEHAENEFLSALNTGPPPELQADTTAWRFLAAVSGGACQGSAKALTDALAKASPLFPNSEAASALGACR